MNIYNKLLAFDELKSKNFDRYLLDEYNKNNTDEIGSAVQHLIPMLPQEIIHNIELYLSYKYEIFYKNNTILSSYYIIKNIFSDYYEVLDKEESKKKHLISQYPFYFRNIKASSSYSLLKTYLIYAAPIRRDGIDRPIEDYTKYMNKLYKDNYELFSTIETAYSLFDKFKDVLQKRCNMPLSDSVDISWLLFNQNLLKIYHDKWLEYCVCGGIDNKGLKDYIQDCCDNDALSIDNKEAISTFIYYYCYELNDPIHLPNIEIVDEVITYISESSRHNSLKSMESILFSTDKSPSKQLFISIDDIDLMNGLEFEEIIAKLFRKMGYDTEVTKASGDQGIDVIASKNGFRYGIQAKCYSNQVGNSAVQEAVAGKTFYSLNKAIVVTNNYFTKSAIKLAESNGVILWDRTILKEKLVYLNQ